ncbi:hypothetical protein ElyMa_006982800 [Elysia marginata]|uniref:Pecanex-like protein n=1 Tax=Elysia marginata TaxID=1093978 RepID=A0AAV4JPL9_9GAST|nr:hypothetical protein ElyMa_006982800 [Elysia marginata]
MGLIESKEHGQHGVMILLNDERHSAWGSWVTYFRQPIVYFYCALPLLAPSLFLIIVPAVDSRCSRTVLAVGITLFFICIFCFVTGVTLTLFNRFIINSRKPTSQDDKKKLVLVANSCTNSGLSTPRTSSSALSPQNLSTSTSSSNPSSRRSSKSRTSSASSAASSGGSQRGGVKMLTKTKTSTRISLKKTGMLRKKGVKFNVDRLPSLIEEDTVRTVSRGNSQSAFQQEVLPHGAAVSANKRPVGLTSPVSKDNIEELKDYLNVIGLGGGSRRELHPPVSTGVNDCRRAKSLEEKDLSRGPSRETVRTGPFTSR